MLSFVKLIKAEKIRQILITLNKQNILENSQKHKNLCQKPNRSKSMENYAKLKTN